MSASSKKKLRKEQNAATMTEKQLAEKKEAKKLKIYTVSFLVVMALIVGIAVVGLGYQGVMNSGIIQRNTHALTVNGHELSSADLNYYYVDAIQSTYNDWYSDYQGNTNLYVQMFYNLDLSKPLDQQAYGTEDGKTWADYFTDLAVENATDVYAMCDAAKDHTLSDEEKKAMEDNFTATSNYVTSTLGYPSMDSYLKTIYGSGASLKTYRKYVEAGTLAQSYYNAYLADRTYEDSDYREYEKDRYNEFSSYSFTHFYVSVNDFLTGGTKAEDGTVTYSDAEKDAALKAAEAAANTLKASGATNAELLDKAIAAIDVYKEDENATSSKSVNTLYDRINATIVEWLADDSRKAGDLEVLPSVTTSTDADGKEVKTTNGYYVVIFEGKDDNKTALVNVRHILAAFDGGTTNDDGTTTYSDSEKKDALDRINKVKDEWEAGEKTEDAFAELAKKHTDDGNGEQGGLYEDVFPGQMVPAFNDWCFDAERATGDVEVVETEYGYHLIYFVGNDELTYRDMMIKDLLLNEEMTEWHEAIVEKATAELKSTSYLQRDYVIARSAY